MSPMWIFNKPIPYDLGYPVDFLEFLMDFFDMHPYLIAGPVRRSKASKKKRTELTPSSFFRLVGEVFVYMTNFTGR